MKKILYFLSSLTFLMANDVKSLNLLDDLYEASEVSTKTKLNVNKTPSVISVLHASQLKKVGVTNLYEALATVPGVQTFMGSAGAKQISMRGNRSITGDKLKLMINGMSINTQILGTTYYYMDMPIENIERIEVVRGPASTIYGSFAHVGAINVITKSSRHNENTYFFNTSSEKTTNLGFTQNIDLKEIDIALDAVFSNNEKSRETGPYSLISSKNSFTSFEDFTNYSLGGIIKFSDDLSLQTRFSELDSQNFYGYGDWPETHDPKRLKTTSLLGEVRYTPNLSRNLSLDLRAGYKNYIYEGFTRVKPYATTGIAPNDLIGDGYYEEHVLYTDSVLKYAIDNHEVLLGIYLSESKEDTSTDYYINNPGISEVTNVENLAVQSDIKRRQYAMYFNDIYTISDKFVANVGLRYDHYNDVDSNLAHKFALLYNHDEKQSYKLMYQRSFRAPSWLEIYGTTAPYIGNTSIKSETIDTFELAYHYQTALNNSFKINFFYSKMKDFINQDASHNFYNDTQRNSYGTEIELQLPLCSTTALQTNYSYVDIEDSNGRNIPFISNHLANLMLFHDINQNFSTATQVKYIGKRKHALADTRDAVSAYTTLDQTLTYTYKEFSLQASVKNIFDQDIIEPTPLGNGDPVYGTGTYTNDYHRNGRTFWISAQWRFE